MTKCQGKLEAEQEARKQFDALKQQYARGPPALTQPPQDNESRSQTQMEAPILVKYPLDFAKKSFEDQKENFSGCVHGCVMPTPNMLGGMLDFSVIGIWNMIL